MWCDLKEGVIDVSTDARTSIRGNIMRGLWLLGTLLTVPLATLAVQAQAAGGSKSAPPDSLARAGITGVPELAAAPGDTGWMVRGWHDFSRYDWATRAAMCHHAVQGAWARLWRDGTHDTVAYSTLVRSAVPAPAVEIGRHCGETTLTTSVVQVTAGVPANSFLAFLRLALDLQDTVVARRLLAAELAHPRPATARAALLGTVVRTLLGSRPIPAPLLEQALAPLDTLGTAPEVLGERYAAHDAMVQHWLALGDTAHLQAALAATMQLYPLLGQALRARFPARKVYGPALQLTVLARGAQQADARAILAQWRQVASEDTALVAGYTQALTLVGTSLALPDRADSTYWFRPGDSLAYLYTIPGLTSAADTAPRLDSGRVTLVVPLLPDYACDSTRGPVVPCQQRYAVLERLARRYGPRGLDIIVLAGTKLLPPTGYEGMSAPSHNVPLPTFAEALEIRHYLQDHWHLPVVVGVLRTPWNYSTADADGSGAARPRLFEPTVWEHAHTLPGPFLPASYIVDRQGAIRAVDVTGEAMLQLFLEQLLTR